MAAFPSRSDRPPRHWRSRPRSIVWPVLLIVVGAVFLLQNFGVLSWSIWGAVWRLWPLVLVLIGIELLFRDLLRGALGAVIAVLIVLVAIGIGIFGWWHVAPSSSETSASAAQALEGASQAAVTVRFGAGQLTIGALDGAASDQLASLSYDGPAQLRPAPSYQVRNGVGQLHYRLGDVRGGWRGFPFGSGSSAAPQMRLMLSPNVPLTLDLQEGASDAHVDLSHLKVSDVQLQTGASTSWLRLPMGAGTTSVRLKGGAATMTVEVPDGVAAQIQYQGGLSTLNVDQSRFPAAGPQMYRSRNYDTAQNRAAVSIEAGMATITVK